jgi:hypothetical protein
MIMALVALLTWILTVLAGLFLLAIWLIEYDPDYQSAAATRLPIPVIAGHVLLAISGLGLWIGYLVTGADKFAWGALAVLGAVVTLGITMAARWVVVRRYGPTAVVGASGTVHVPVPPERHFPVSVVVGHGILALTTLTLVLLSNLGIGGS